MKFSVDMIRLAVKVKKKDLTFLRSCCDSGLITYYDSFDFRGFRDNFKIEETVFYNVPFLADTRQDSVNRVWLGANHNSQKSDRLYTKLYIEYNPNKTDLFFGVTKQVFDYYFRNNADVVIVSCDVAIDFHDVSINDLIFTKNRFRRILDFRQDSGRTIYFGKKTTSGYTKVYDKAAEQGQAGIWTRCEFSFKIDIEVLPVAICKYDFECSIPDLTFYSFAALPADVDTKDKCCLLAVLQGVYILDDFGRRYRDKLKNIVDSLATYRINKDLVYDDCKKCLSDYVKNIYTVNITK